MASDDKGCSSLNQKASHPIFLWYSFHVLNHQEHFGQDLLSLVFDFLKGSFALGTLSTINTITVTSALKIKSYLTPQQISMAIVSIKVILIFAQFVLC